MGIEDRDWYREEKREERRRREQWEHLQKSGEKRKRWNRTMPDPSELKHKSRVPDWNTMQRHNTPTWKFLFYWSAGLNVVMLGALLFMS